MRRRSPVSCASCGLLALVTTLFAGTSGVRADFMDAMPVFVPRVLRGACKTTEELCPAYAGSDDLRCTDFTQPETCGGCVSDGEGLDCTSVPGYFMHGCTSRGQCTGCRWKKGGMEKSLKGPDYLVCTTILTQPTTHHRRKPPREAQLSFAKQIMKKTEKARPMAALRPQADYAADKAVMREHVHVKSPQDVAEMMKKPYLGQMLGQQGQGKGQQPMMAPHNNPAMPKGVQPGGGLVQAQAPQLEAAKRLLDSKAQAALLADGNRPGRRDGLALFSPQELPEPPNWLISLVTAHLVTLPLSTEDHVILNWFQTLQDAFVRVATRYKALAAEEPKKKYSNADRFRLNLPPKPPKALVRPNQPAPFILPGMDYTDEEVEAMGLQDYLKPSRYSEDEVVTVKSDATTFWGRLVKVVLESNPSTIRPDVMEALWMLLDKASRPASERQAARGYGPAPGAKDAPAPKAADKREGAKRGGVEGAAQLPLPFGGAGTDARAQDDQAPKQKANPAFGQAGQAAGQKDKLQKDPAHVGQLPPQAAYGELDSNPNSKQRPFEDFIKERTEGRGSPQQPEPPAAKDRPFADLMRAGAKLGGEAAVKLTKEEETKLKEQRIAKHMKDTLAYREKEVAQLRKLLQQERDRREWLENSLEDPGIDTDEANDETEGSTADDARESPLADGVHEEANAFERHIQKANKAKALKLADQIQPDKDFIDLEKEDLTHGGEKIKGANGKAKPMMAGMAKARPAAHLKGIGEMPPFKKKR